MRAVCGDIWGGDIVSEQNRERMEERLKQIEESNQSLADKGRLLLTVQLSTKEEAEELMRWMYSKTDKPMLSELIEIAWDKEVVTKQEFELVEAARRLNR